MKNKKSVWDFKLLWAFNYLCFGYHWICFDFCICFISWCSVSAINYAVGLNICTITEIIEKYK